jgi:hypothetical protein
MTQDEYVLSIVAKYRPAGGQGSPAYQAAQNIYPTIQSWAGKHLLEATFSGSYAKGTGVRGSTDVDIFISLDPQAPGTLKELYDGLYSYLVSKQLGPRKQNVSIGLNYFGISVDLVPARKQAGNTNDHSLFRNKAQTWTQTNVQQHINLVSQSERLDEIRAIKIWRNLHQLSFSSFYLELTVLDALYNKNKNQPATNVLTVLEYFRDSFTNARVVDPANSNNIISEDLTSSEKSLIANQARESRTKPRWEDIIW